MNHPLARGDFDGLDLSSAHHVQQTSMSTPQPDADERCREFRSDRGQRQTHGEGVEFRAEIAPAADG